MSTYERMSLSPNSVITLQSTEADPPFARPFHIVQMVGEGASTICYEAYHKGSGTGVLKEFYPRNVRGERMTDNALRFPGGRDKFIRNRDAYMALVDSIVKLRRLGDLSSFLPPFEVYEGPLADDGCSTYYLWDPSPAKTTFASVIDEMYAGAPQKPETQVYQILSALRSLTQCVMQLHAAGYVHRDIKPSNFGFTVRAGETLPQSITLFDLDTLAPIGKATRGRTGTSGYTDEAYPGTADVRTDLYSIGAVLFDALVGPNRHGEHSGYDRSDYDRIPELVNGSPLLRRIGGEAGTRLREALIKVLRTSLADRERRYQLGEELLNDLEAALSYVAPIAGLAELQSAEPGWELHAPSAATDPAISIRDAAALACALYEHPVYECLKDTERPLHILICGFDQYAQKYLDMCLQMTQMLSNPVQVLVRAENEEEIRSYLDARPALGQFYQINGEQCEGGAPYGMIRFASGSLPDEDRKEWAHTLRSGWTSKEGSFRPAAAVFSIGSDRRNLAAARAAAELSSEAGAPCSISFMRRRPDDAVAKDGVHAIDVGTAVRKDPIFAELERMAFNVQLTWEPSLNVDFDSIESKFRDPYNYYSCLCCAVAIRYGLWSIGITGSDAVCAELFEERLSDTGDTSTRMQNVLAWKEHKRWVTEKVCAGWSPVQSLASCLASPGSASVPAAKEHACVVRSLPEPTLEMLEEEHGAQIWDSADPALLDSLDPLDRMSVELHRLLVRNAASHPDSAASRGKLSHLLGSLVFGDPAARQTFTEWNTVMNAVANGNFARAGHYDKLRHAFLQTADNLTADVRHQVKQLADTLDHEFQPLLASIRRTDYKKIDATIVRNIPFILTYTTDFTLIVPFRTGNSTTLFGNVSAATVVNPSRIVYPVLLREKSEIDELIEASVGIASYAAHVNLRAEAEFVVAYDPDETAVDEQALRHAIEVSEWARCRFVRTTDCTVIMERLLDCPDSLAGDCRTVAAEKNQAPLSYVLAGASFYSKLPSYSFSSADMRFTNVNGCEALTYVRKRCSMDIDDMIALQRSTGRRTEDWDFTNSYQDLWNVYRSHASAWKELCRILSDYAREHDEIASFARQRNTDAEHILQYSLPPICCREATDLAEKLKRYGVVHRVEYDYTSRGDLFTLKLIGCKGSWEEYDKVFGNPMLFYGLERITCYLDTRRNAVRVKVNRLTAQDVELCDVSYPGWESRMRTYREILDELMRLGCVRFSYCGGTVSLTYASPACKQLMTTAGMVLELYTYYEARNTGEFDDIVCGYEVTWGSSGATSEFDCIMTKGFRSLFVECKARGELSQAFYFKLASLCELFGVNATAVLVADIYHEDDEILREINDMQRERGSMLRVVTITGQNDIQRVGRILVDLLQ